MDQNQMMMDYLMQMGEMQPEQEELLRKRQMVEQLRGMSQRSPEMRSSGRMMHAANPLEFLNQGLQGYAGMKMGQEADAQGRDIKQRRSKALGDMRDQWMPKPVVLPPQDDPLAGMMPQQPQQPPTPRFGFGH